MMILIFPCIHIGLSSSSDYPMTVPPPLSELGSESCSTTAMSTPDEIPLNGVIESMELLIWEVLPSTGCEFITLRSFSSDPVDLNGTYLSDGEGTIHIRKGLTVEPLSFLTFCTDIETLRTMGITGSSLEFGDEVIEIEGTFRLADKGDEICLSVNGLTDVLVYGSSTSVLEGWNGLPFPKPGKGNSVLRLGSVDTNSTGDWIESVPGRSSLEPLREWGKVEPFISPENARNMVVRELRYASRTAHLSFYQISDPVIVDEMGKCASRGTEVIILMQGQPVGGLSLTESDSSASLLHAGVEVILIRQEQGYKRYSYLHCKFGIFDSRRVLVMSENLLHSSLENNRGWGAVVEGQNIARYFERMFHNDSDPLLMDVSLASPMEFEFSGAITVTSDLFVGTPPSSSECWVSTLVSPDHSLPSLLELIREAKSRIFLEQLYFELDLFEDLPRELINASRRGVEVRILLDSSFFTASSSSNEETVRKMSTLGEDENIPLYARSVSQYHGFNVLHNKGMIVDDKVLISSINWCRNAFLENREVGMVIESSKVTEYFTDCFLNDWSIDPFPPIASIDGPSQVSESDTICLSGLNSSDNAGISEYLWMLDGEPISGVQGPLILISLEPGFHKITLEVIDAYNNTDRATLPISVSARDEASMELMLLPLTSIPIFTAIWLLKRVKHRK